MQKKHANLMTVIFMSVFLVLSFMPIVFMMSYWKNKAPGVGSATRSWSVGVNLYSRYLPLALIIVALSVICIILSVMKLVGSKNNLIGYECFVPFAATALFGVISCMDIFTKVPNGDPGGTANWGYYGFYEYSPAWGFYIECALLIAVCVFSILDIRGLLTELPEEKFAKVMVTETAANPVVADAVEELKKYKELLDSGVITQEEFEIKKKQLLGL